MKNPVIQSSFKAYRPIYGRLRYGGPGGPGGPHGGGPHGGGPFGGRHHGGPPPPPRGYFGRPPRYGRGCGGCGCLTLILPAAIISIIVLISVFI